MSIETNFQPDEAAVAAEFERAGFPTRALYTAAGLGRGALTGVANSGADMVATLFNPNFRPNTETFPLGRVAFLGAAIPDSQPQPQNIDPREWALAA